MKHVLITRPEPDATEMKDRIEALGCRVSVAPLIDIVFEPIASDVVEGAAALVATSRNGLRALARSQAMHTAIRLPLFAVGSGTAQTAKHLGFADVRTGAGTARDLVLIIAKLAQASAKPVLHLAGDHLAFDLGEALAKNGIVLNAVPAYRSVAAETLPDGIVRAILRDEIDGVILMSPRSAEIWTTCVSKLRPTPTLANLIHVCLSDAVLNALIPPPVNSAVAKRPNSEEILALVKRLAARSKAE